MPWRRRRTPTLEALLVHKPRRRPRRRQNRGKAHLSSVCRPARSGAELRQQPFSSAPRSIRSCRRQAAAENFILHWSSERPVPVVTIDSADGRTIKRPSPATASTTCLTLRPPMTPCRGSIPRTCSCEAQRRAGALPATDGPDRDTTLAACTSRARTPSRGNSPRAGCAGGPRPDRR